MRETTGPTILVVDDEVDMRLLVRAVIDMANHGLTIVGEAEDGLEAVTAWRDLGGPPVPDVIVLDNRMPRLTGIEAAERILAERPDQLIVLYSSFLDDTVRRDADAVGIARCVSKENLSDLPAVIREMCAA